MPKQYHRIKVVVTDIEHDSSYQILNAYGCTFKRFPKEWEYLGEGDAIHIYFSDNHLERLCIDSIKSGSEIMLGYEGERLEFVSDFGVIDIKINRYKPKKWWQLRKGEDL